MTNIRKGFIGLIALLIVFAIVAYLSFKVLNIYLNRSTTVDKRNKEIMSESGVSGPNYPKMLDSVSKKVDDLNRQTSDLENRAKDLTR